MSYEHYPPLANFTIATGSRNVDRKLRQSHLKFFFNHRKFGNFETCKYCYLVIWACNWLLISGEQREATFTWSAVYLRVELWLLSQRVVGYRPKQSRLSRKPQIISAIGNSKSKGSVFHHSEIGEKVTTCRLSVVKFSLARTGLNHTRPVKWGECYTVERVSIEKDFMPYEVYI